MALGCIVVADEAHQWQNLRKTSSPFLDREVSGGVLSAVLKCSRVYVRELTASGVLSRNKAGYPLRPNVGAYAEHLRRERGQDLSQRSEAAAEHHRLRAQMVALQIATHEKRYVPVEVYDAMIDDMTGMFLTALSSLPAIMAPHDLTGRRKWEGFVYDTCKRLADNDGAGPSYGARAVQRPGGGNRLGFRRAR